MTRDAESVAQARRGRRSVIVLGSSVDLHPGVHASMVDTPPAGFRYRIRPARHVYLRDGTARRFSPLRDQHFGEYLDFGPGKGLVHSAWWPVLGRSAWTVDLDEIPYPLIVGRTATSAAFRRQYCRQWTRALRERLMRRLRTMLDAYTHPSCQGVLFWTQWGVDHAMGHLEAIGCASVIDPLLRKSYVVRPAAKALAAAVVRHKWQSPQPLRVVFCGRDFETKDGDLALRVIRSLQSTHAALSFTFIGSIPTHAWTRHGDVLRSINVLDRPRRSVVLGEMAKAHILFHPSPSESLGMVLLEAAACGLAVVCSDGRDMAHLGELLPQEGTLRVNRDRGTASQHEAGFRGHLARLASEPDHARSMALRNHRFAVSGPISIDRRNEMLGRIYERANRCAATPPLTLERLTEGTRLRPTSVTARDLEALHLAWERREARHGARVFF